MLAQSIRNHAARHPNGVALFDQDGAASWDQLKKLLTQQRLHLGRKEGPLALRAFPTRQTVAVLAACEEAGHDVLLIPDYYGSHRANEQAATIGAAILDPDNVESRDLKNTPMPINGKPGVVGVLTSGSEGEPKCVRHDWRTLTAAVRMDLKHAKRRWLSAYPVAHFAGLQVLAHTMLNGAALGMLQGYQPETAFKAICAWKITHLNGTPTFMRQLLWSIPAEAWSQTALEHITLGGEAVDQTLLTMIARVLPQVRRTHIYASSELGGVFSVSDGYAGFPIELLKQGRLQIRNGELFVRRGRGEMLGYWGKTAPNNDWLPTGDMVQTEGDRVFFTGRKSQVINVGGQKVSPPQVANIVRRVPGVRDAVAGGVPNSVMGHLIKVLICASGDCDRPALKRKVRATCMEKLPPYAVPRLIEFVESLPKTPNQKAGFSMPTSQKEPQL